MKKHVIEDKNFGGFVTFCLPCVIERVCIYICVCMCIYACVYICIYIYIYMYVCVCICMHVCVYRVCGGRF